MKIQLSKRAAEYKKKKKEESGNITYIYDEKHVEKRDQKKAQRLAKLSKSINKVRTKAKKDINNEDYKIALPALAVTLIDLTYERVGNRYSAKDMKHYGVTTWLKKHFTFLNSKAVIKYMGKSGVKQIKKINNPKIVRILKTLTENKKNNDPVFQINSYTLNDNMVNKYLKPFNITAKDIRGLHANKEMKKALKSPSKNEKQRKQDFKNALEKAAEIVGHDPATLKNQYLIPGFETKYVNEGQILGKIAGLTPIQKVSAISLNDSWKLK